MSCFTGKIGYATENLAKTAMTFTQLQKEKEKGRKVPVRVFYCDDCGRWHLTSQEKKK